MCVGDESIDLVLQTQLADRIGSKNTERHYSSSIVIFVISSANHFHSDCHPFDGVETNPT